MAKYQMMKLPGGILSPLNDEEAERLKSFQNGEQYEIEIKRQRNPAFHRKVFAFFNFCFDCWSGSHSIGSSKIQPLNLILSASI